MSRVTNGRCLISPYQEVCQLFDNATEFGVFLAAVVIGAAVVRFFMQAQSRPPAELGTTKPFLLNQIPAPLRPLAMEVDEAAIDVMKVDPWEALAGVKMPPTPAMKTELETLRQQRIEWTDSAERFLRACAGSKMNEAMLARMADDGAQIRDELRALEDRLLNFLIQHDLVPRRLVSETTEESTDSLYPIDKSLSRGERAELTELRQRVRGIVFYDEAKERSLIEGKRQQMPEASTLQLYRAVVHEYDHGGDYSGSVLSDR